MLSAVKAESFLWQRQLCFKRLSSVSRTAVWPVIKYAALTLDFITCRTWLAFLVFYQTLFLHFIGDAEHADLLAVSSQVASRVNLGFSLRLL